MHVLSVGGPCFFGFKWQDWSEWQGESSSSFSLKDGKGRKKLVFQVLRTEDPYTHAHVPGTRHGFGRPKDDLSGGVDTHATARMFPVRSCTAHWHVFLCHLPQLFIQVQMLVQFFFYRKVIGHNCSTVRLKSSWCAFHIVQRYQHTFISLISGSHTKDTTHSSLGQKMYNSVVQHIAHHVERQKIGASVSLGRKWSVWLYCQSNTLHSRERSLASTPTKNINTYPGIQ